MYCPTPATQKRRSPKGRQGVHQTLWQCTLSHACHAQATEPQGTPGRTSDPLAVHIVPRLPRKRRGAPRDARAYIRPLGSTHCPTPATQKRRSPKGRQGVHQTLWQCTLSHACHAKATEPQGTPGRTSDPLAVHLVPRLPRKSSGAPRDARAYIRPLGSAHCPTPATQKRRSPKGRQGVHPTPWQCTLSHACHAKDAEPHGTPGRTSDPLAVHIVPRLPRKRGGAPRDARAYIRPLGSTHCPTLATQKRRSPKGRQGVHQTPWQCTLSHACHAKEAEPQGTPGRTSDPLAVQSVPRLPRKRGRAPRDARAYIRPFGNAHCLTPATQKRRSPKGRQGIHPTPWQCTLSRACDAKDAEPHGTPGRTSDPLAVHIVPRLPRKRGGAPRDARAYIRPFGNAHCLTPATQKRRSPKGRQGVHLTPWQCTLSHACHAKAAEPQGTPGRTSNPLAVHIVPRLPRKSGGAPRDARAYIRPLGSAHCPTPATQKTRSPTGRQGVHQTPWQYTLSHACHAKEAEPQGTPGRTSDPLAVHIVPRLPRKRGGAPRDARAYIRPLGSAHCPTPATQKRRSPKGRQGVHPTPWQCRLSHACHAKEAEPQGTPGRTSNPLAVHIVPRLPRKSGGAPRDARAYIRPLGSAHCPTPATQKTRSPTGRQGVHQTPWQYTLSHACHAKEAEPQGTPGRTSDPLAVHIVPRLPRKRGGAPRDARAYIRPLGSAHCPTPATQKRRSPKGRQGVHQTPWQCRLSHACHAKEAEPQGTPGRTSDPLAAHIVPRLPRKMHMSE